MMRLEWLTVFGAVSFLAWRAAEHNVQATGPHAIDVMVY